MRMHMSNHNHGKMHEISKQINVAHHAYTVPNIFGGYGFTNGREYCCSGAAGNEVSFNQTISRRFFEQFHLPNVDPNSALTSAVLDFTSRELV